MELRLKYPPVPRHARQLAEVCVEAALQISNVRLDFSGGSLSLVEGVLDQLSKEGVETESIASTLFCFGCYVGEVLIGEVGGSWVETGQSRMAEFASWPMVIETRKGCSWNPIGKVFKRFEEGSSESLVYFLQVVRSE